MPLLPEVPDAATSVMSALHLRDGFAARATSRYELGITDDALTKRRVVEFNQLMQGLPIVAPPKCMVGVTYVILRKGIVPKFGMDYNRSDELAAAVALAMKFPRVSRVDLPSISCTVLLPSRDDRTEIYGDLSCPVLPNAFVLDASKLGNATAIKTEANMWAQLSRSLIGSGPGLPRARQKRNAFTANVSAARAAACAAIREMAVEFVAHSTDDEDTQKMWVDLRMLTRLERLTIVVWTPNAQKHSPETRPTLLRPDGFPDSIRIEQFFAERSAKPISCIQTGRSARTAWVPPREMGDRATPRENLGARTNQRQAPNATSRQRSTLQGMHFTGFGRADTVWAYMAEHG